MSKKNVPYQRFKNYEENAVTSTSDDSYDQEFSTPGAVLTDQAAARAARAEGTARVLTEAMRPATLVQGLARNPAAQLAIPIGDPYNDSEEASAIRGLIDAYKKIFGGQELTGNAIEIANELQRTMFQTRALTPEQIQRLVEEVDQYYIPYRNRKLFQLQSLRPLSLSPSQELKLFRHINPKLFQREPSESRWVNPFERKPRENSWAPPPKFKWEATMSEKMRERLLGSSGLSRKLMKSLSFNESLRAPQTKKMKQIADKIDKRVDATKVPEVVLKPPITMNELRAYAMDMTFSPNGPPARYLQPPQFATEVGPLPQFTQASCLTTKKQLQEQLDELIKIQKEKYTMLLNLQRINVASTHESNEIQGRPQALEKAEEKSALAIVALREQLQELRERIDRLSEEITRISKGNACSMLGGSKIKSKHTKSNKSNKSKRRNRKYSKRK
jgi:hypothetical protein